MPDHKLPALPEPTLERHEYELWGQNVRADMFTADQLRAYGQSCHEAGRVAGLEEAAAACDSKERRKWEILAHGGQLEGIGPLDCAAAIRELKGPQ